MQGRSLKTTPPTTITDLGSGFSVFGIFKIFKFSIPRKIFFEKLFFKNVSFFIKIMLMRSSTHSSDPVPPLGTVYLLFYAEPKNGKSIKNENHSIFATSESFVNPLGNWGFGICLGWFWCSKIVKKSFLIKKNRFLVNLRHFYNIYLNIV